MAETVEQGVSAGDDWKHLCARWKIGVVVASLAFGMAGIYVFSLTPLYRAQMQILLPLTAIEDPADRRNLPVAAADAFVVHSFTDVVKDDGISGQVVDKLRLMENPEFNKKPGPFAAWISDLRQRLNPSAEGPALFKPEQVKHDAILHDYENRLKAVNDNKSLTLVLSFDASDPYLAQRIVDAHAQAFIQSQVQRRRMESQAKVSWMKTEVDRAAEEARAAQVAVQLHMSSVVTNHDAAADQVTELKFRQMVAASKQTVYEAMLRRYQDMIADERYEGSGIQILSPANLPTKPDFPKKPLMLSVAAVASLILGLAVAWITSITRRKETPDEVLARLRLDKLGEVNFPKRWPRRWIGRQARLRTALFWEQIAGVRSTVVLPSTSDGLVVAITSAVAREGKSLVAAGLARTFACGGAKTLLLDLNVRKPRFSAPAEGGGSLQDLLAGFSSLQHTVISIDKETPLYLLASSKGVPIDVLAVTGAKMRAILKQARKQFDVVVIDTPAMEVVSDTFLIGALADEVILAALQGKEGLSDIDDAVAKLRSRSISIRGVVVTDSRKPPRRLLGRLRPYIQGSRPHVVWPEAAHPGGRPLSRSNGRGKVKRSPEAIQHIGSA